MLQFTEEQHLADPVYSSIQFISPPRLSTSVQPPPLLCLKRLDC